MSDFSPVGLTEREQRQESAVLGPHAGGVGVGRRQSGKAVKVRWGKGDPDLSGSSVFLRSVPLKRTWHNN